MKITIEQMNAKGGFQRSLSVGAVDKEARTVELAFSSEWDEGVRWFGIEVLDHSAGAVDLSRLRNGGAVLVNHDHDDHVGVVEEAIIGADRVGRATVRFGTSARAEEIFQDVSSGIRRHVSVAYRIAEAKLKETRDDGLDVYLVTRWQPYEISIVPVPFDPTVGVGRSENTQVEAPGGSVEIRDEHETKHEGNTRMSTETKSPTIDVVAERKAAVESEQARVKAILEMGNQYKAADLAREFALDSSKSAADFQAALLKRFEEKSNQPLIEQMKGTEIGLTDKERKQFSFLRAIRHLADPSNVKLREAAAFERECSRAASEETGKDPQGILIPTDVLNRAFSTTTPSSNTGANIIATELQSGSFIEMLRNRSWVLPRARKLAGLVGNVDIPKQTVGNTAYWVGEGSAPTTGEMGVQKISLTPKTLAAFSDITRKLLNQSTPDAEALTRDDLLKTLALALDLAAIYGTAASNQPRGVKNFSGINTVDFAAANPTFAELVSMETLIASDNADVAGMAYAANAAFRGYAKTTAKLGSGTESTIWEPGNTVNGYACEISNQITAGDVFFGNWQELIVALWSGLDLTVDPYALSTSGGLRVIAFQDVDFQVRHAESFTYGVLVP